MSNKKLTKRDHFNALLNIEEVKSNETLVDFINHELELLAKKNSAERGMTKTQKENADLQQKILETLEPNMLYTVSDLCKLMGIESNQKMTHLLTPLADEGKLVRTVEKRRAYYSLP